MSLLFLIVAIVLFVIAAICGWFVDDIELRSVLATIAAGLASFAAAHLPFGDYLKRG